MRKKKFLYNSISTAFLQVVVLISGLIVPRIMLTYYGSEINGLVTSISQFISYFNLVEAGLASAAVYALYKPLANNDNDEISCVVSTAKKFYIQAGYIFLVLIICLAIIYPIFIKSSLLSKSEMFLLIIALGMNGCLEFFTLAKYRALLTADQSVYVISVTSSISTIINTLIILLLSMMKFNIVIVRIGCLVAIILRSIILYTYTKKKYPYINYNSKIESQRLDKRWDALFLQVLGATQIGAPVILATIFTTLKQVSVYSIYNMVISGINNLLGIFSTSLSSTFGDIIIKNETDKLRKNYSIFEKIYYVLIAIVYGISFNLLLPFILIYTKDVTDINYNLPTLSILFVINGLLSNFKTPQGMLVISAGLYKETKIQSSIQAGIIIFLGIILTPKYGLYGIMISSIVSNSYRNLDLWFYIPQKVTKLPIKSTFKNVLQSLVIFILICLASSVFDMYRIDSVIKWISSGIMLTIYSIFISFIVILIFDRKVISEFKLFIKRKN